MSYLLLIGPISANCCGIGSLQVNKPMVKVQLPPFVTTVKKAVNVTRNVSQVGGTGPLPRCLSH